MDRPPYRTALRLYAIAVERWAEIDATYYQADIIGFRIDRFLNCVYAWCVERINPDKREEWEAQLNAPLPGEDTRVVVASEADIEREGAMFMAAMSQHQILTGG
jgi:hypothetical protein